MAPHDHSQIRTDVDEWRTSDDGPLLLLSANSAWNIRNFRLDLIRTLQANGYRVAVASPTDEGADDFAAMGIHFHRLPMRPTGTSPIGDAALLARYVRLMRQVRPAAYLGFTAKPNIYGSIAARLYGLPTINNLTGLGTTFIHGRWLGRIVAELYRSALRRSQKVFFHNPDDRDLFVRRRLVAPEQADVIPGSGIHLERFAVEPLPAAEDAPVFLFAGRLLWEKGIGEFVEAARTVKRHHPRARFQLAGALGDSGRGVPAALLQQWESEGLVEYLGSCGDIRPWIAGADCVVLPSWREGLPRVLLEAAAMGRPLIASDAPGCRHAVVDGVTGFVSKTRSPESLADCMLRMIQLPAAERRAMGLRARSHAEEHFGIERVCRAYLSALEELGIGPARSGWTNADLR